MMRARILNNRKLFCGRAGGPAMSTGSACRSRVSSTRKKRNKLRRRRRYLYTIILLSEVEFVVIFPADAIATSFWRAACKITNNNNTHRGFLNLNRAPMELRGWTKIKKNPSSNNHYKVLLNWVRRVVFFPFFHHSKIRFRLCCALIDSKRWPIKAFFFSLSFWKTRQRRWLIMLSSSMGWAESPICFFFLFSFFLNEINVRVLLVLL